MKTVVYIHGLISTYRSFNYILQNLPDHLQVMAGYDSDRPLADIIADIEEDLPIKGSYSIVGHSLGGLIGTVLAIDNPRVEKLITISSPLGGSKAATFIQWIPNHPRVIRDITQSSHFVQLVQSAPVAAPTLSIISTAGHLHTGSDLNDGVVSLPSQRALPFAEKIEVEANHFEVLLDNETVKHIHTHIFGA